MVKQVLMVFDPGGHMPSKCKELAQPVAVILGRVARKASQHLGHGLGVESVFHPKKKYGRHRGGEIWSSGIHWC